RVRVGDLIELCLAYARQVADIESEHYLVRNARTQNDTCGFGVEPEVELRRVGGIAGHAYVAAHENDALDPGFDFRFHAKRESDIGHRPESQYGYIAGMMIDFGDELVDRVAARLVRCKPAAGSGNHGCRILREGADVAERAPTSLPFLR